MTAFLQPLTWAEALEAKAEHPDALPVQGGTDVMVELNAGRRPPVALLDLSRIPGLDHWQEKAGTVRLGAAVTFSRIITDLSDRLPGLVKAACLVGSRQIRNRGTVGGNLGTASPAGDTHPSLLVADAVVEVGSRRRVRSIPIAEFYVGPKRHILAADELIRAVLVPVVAGPQQYAKVGVRRAMAVGIASVALALKPAHRCVATAIGCAAPTPRRAREAEDFLAEVLHAGDFWDNRDPIPTRVVARFGELVSGAAEPIDDMRGSARYRSHVVSVLARRELNWAWNDFRGGRTSATPASGEWAAGGDQRYSRSRESARCAAGVVGPVRIEERL